jgi:type VI secretion system protein ImpK
MSEQDPFKLPEATVVRPRPGAGKRGSQEPSRVRAAAPPVADAEPISETARELLGAGLNPLVRAASPLLLLGGQLRGSTSPIDVDGLRRHALEEVRRFEERARAGAIPNEIVVAARYALCAHLDEAVLSTPWGAQSEWSQHPLLVTLHREAWGGEKFFDMLDRVSADPARYVDLMELLYLCLALGFAGKYEVADRGHERLAAIQQDLYRKIRAQRSAAPADLSLRWRGLEDRRNPLIRYVPWWVVGVAALAALALAYTFYYANLASLAVPVQAELSRIGTEEFTERAPAPATPPAPGPRLKPLLAQEEQAHLLTVEEEGARSVVTLLAADLFASGSATIDPAHYDTLQRIARAINQVPGRVLVEGHTDDQPIHSLRFADNFELSRERAISVVKVLQLTLENRTGIQVAGVGSTRPRAVPASTPENRALNRRVEIIHVAGL